MKNVATFFVFGLLVGLLFADPAEVRVIDLTALAVQPLKLYKADQKTFTWTIKKDGAAVDLTGYSPYMYAAASNRASFSGIKTADCSWVSQASGQFTAVFPVNTLTNSGDWIYGVGVISSTSSNNTTFYQGKLTVTDDPY